MSLAPARRNPDGVAAVVAASPPASPTAAATTPAPRPAGSADSRFRRARGLLDGWRARRDQRAQLDDAGDIDGIEGVSLVAHAGQVDDDVLTLDPNVGFGDAALFELVADQVTNASRSSSVAPSSVDSTTEMPPCRSRPSTGSLPGDEVDRRTG